MKHSFNYVNLVNLVNLYNTLLYEKNKEYIIYIIGSRGLQGSQSLILNIPTASLNASRASCGVNNQEASR